MVTDDQRAMEPVSLWKLWFALLGGAVAWSLRLLIVYPLIPHVCTTGWLIIPHLISLLFALVAVAAGFVAWRSLQKARNREETKVEEWGRERVIFMANTGMLANGIFLLVILAEWSTIFFLNPCVTR